MFLKWHLILAKSEVIGASFDYFSTILLFYFLFFFISLYLPNDYLSSFILEGKKFPVFRSLKENLDHLLLIVQWRFSDAVANFK